MTLTMQMTTLEHQTDDEVTVRALHAYELARQRAARYYQSHRERLLEAAKVRYHVTHDGLPKGRPGRKRATLAIG